MKFSKATYLSLITALLFLLCFEPYNLWFISYVAFVPLMLAVQSASHSRSAMFYGLTGIVVGAGVYYGVIGYGVNALLLIIISFLIVFSLWGFLVSWLLSKRTEPAIHIFAPAFIWMGIETLSASSPLGVPIYFGLSYAGQPWLIQSASLFGISGIGFLIVLSNSLFVYVIRAKKYKQRMVSPVIIAVLMLLLNPLFGYLHLNAPLASSEPFRVAAVQPNIDSETYTRGWQKPENRVFMHQTLKELTLEAVQGGAEMIFWSEGGNGYMNMRVPELRQSLFDMARNANVDLVISSSDMDSDGNRFNSLFSVSSKGQLLGRYDKQRLLPLAETDLVPGINSSPLSTSRGKLGVAICYESSFPDLLRAQTSQGAELLFVTSSEAAFKRSSLAMHNAGLSVFRAVENERWLIRAANTGPSLIVSPRGVVIKQSGFHTRGVVVGSVALMTGITFYTRSGYILPILSAISVLILCAYILYVMFATQRKKQKKSSSTYPIKEKIRPVFFAVFMYSITLSVVVISSFYVVNRASVKPQSAVMDHLSDLFMPAVIPVVDTVGKGFMQAGNNTCGAAALAFVLSYLGRETHEDEIVGMVKLNERGTNMLELKHAAEFLKYSAKGVSENYTALSEESLPVIAYINDSHYVVVIEVKTHSVSVFDPALGYVQLSRSLFEQSWNGYLLLIRPAPIPDLIDKTPASVASLHSSST